MFAVMVALTVVSVSFSQDPAGNQGDKKESSQDESGNQKKKKKVVNQAWEYWAYRVNTWVVTDGSYETQLVLNDTIEQINSLSYIADSSAWKVNADAAPALWNWRFIRYLDDPSRLNYLSATQIEKLHKRQEAVARAKAKKDGGKYEDILAAMPAPYTPLEQSFSEMINGLENEAVDKLMIVRLRYQDGVYETSAREYDLRTRKWGATTSLETGVSGRVGALAFRALSNAFMPITRLEKVYDYQNMETRKTERWARARIRAIGVAKTVEKDSAGKWVTSNNTSSPVWVRDQDILLPVVRRVTREKVFESTQTIGWTFLVIRNRDGTKLECRTQSKDRVPLSGRTGTRIEKLALVIRPPNRPTLVTMYARAIPVKPEFRKPPDPLANYEVYSRSPGDPIEKASDIVGITDFFGQVVIPPSDNGLRLLFIKSGYRPLAKLPVLPGLEEELVIELPNDEDRLFAEGIVRGLENEVKDLLAQRKVLVLRIEKLLEKGKIAEADALFKFYRSLNTAQLMKEKVNFERQQLIVKDESQRPRINDMFDNLVKTVDKFMTSNEERRILTLINQARRANAGG